jgi:hypothetical protein
VTAEEKPPNDQTPEPPWAGRTEAWYRWIGWLPGLVFLALARTAPNLWLGLALGLFGVCQVGHWAVERIEAARG